MEISSASSFAARFLGVYSAREGVTGSGDCRNVDWVDCEWPPWEYEPWEWELK